MAYLTCAIQIVNFCRNSVELRVGIEYSGRPLAAESIGKAASPEVYCERIDSHACFCTVSRIAEPAIDDLGVRYFFVEAPRVEAKPVCWSAFASQGAPNLREDVGLGVGSIEACPQYPGARGACSRGGRGLWRLLGTQVLN